MKSIKLQSLILRNFKGVKDFEFTPNGENAAIFGDNATGKTTIYDAFLYLLFNKDSQNRADFDIKALDNTGEPAHGLEHEVSAMLEVDRKSLELVKRFSEKWVKRRGKAQAEFTGHQTDHFINGIPVKAGEFKAAIADLIDEETFKLLTNPRYFNESLKWERRREIILQICGDVAVDDVLSTDKSLAALATILDTRSADDHKKAIHVQRKRINAELEKIPVQIDEATRSLPETPEHGIDSLKAKKTSLEADRATKQRELAALGKPEGQMAIEKQIFDLEKKAEIARIAFESAKSKSVSDLNAKLAAIENSTKTASQAHAAEKQRLADLLAMQSADEKSLIRFRELWIEGNAINPPDAPVDETCPTCRQSLPSDLIEAARRKALESWNLEKSKRLEGLARSGQDVKGQIVKNAAAIEGTQDKIDSIAAVIKKYSKESEALKADLEKASARQPDFDTVTAEKIEALKASLKPEADLTRQKAELEKVIDHIVDEIKTCDAGILAHESSVKILARIDELGKQEKILAAEFEALEGQLFLIEKFTRARVAMLENKVAENFHLARFKMFENQINEGIKDCCETTFKGVPYGSLNNAARINVGLDIINTLIRHYGTSAPIFIDNAESVTGLTAVSAQTIRLIVSEKHKTLTIGE